MTELSALTGTVSDEKKPSTKFFRAPLLWILFPQIAAYILCECGFSLSDRAGFAAAGISLAFALLAAIFAFFAPRGKSGFCNDFWTLCLPVAIFFLSGAWWSFHAPKNVNWSDKPETELVLDLKIETPFRSAGKFRSGLARVESSSEYAKTLCGTRIFYRFPQKESTTVPLEGMRLRLRGIVSGVSDDSQPNSGFREFLHSRRTFIAVENGDCVEISSAGTLSSVKSWFADRKSDLIGKLLDGESSREREQRVLAAMLLGETSLLPSEQREDFMLTGTMHIFAVSGLHVSLFAACLFGIFSRAGLPYWGIALTTIFVSCFYVMLTGASPSAVRAWIMIVFLLSARLLGRNSNPLNALVLAATCTLWHNPLLLDSLGFQLSYGVVASIFLYGIPLGCYWSSRKTPFEYIPVKSRTPFQRFVIRIREKSIGLFAISLGTFVAGAAFLAGAFEIFTPIAVLTNFVLVPFIGILLGTAIAAAIFFCLPGTSWLASILWNADCRLMFLTEVFAGTASEISDGVKIHFPFPWMGTLGGSLILCIFAAGAFFESLRSRPRLRFALPLVFLCSYLLAFVE